LRTADDRFPALDAGAIASTRGALHAYAKVIGSWSRAARKHRKHWWHASLRPSLYGLTTGVVYGDPDFEIELDLAHSNLCIRTCRSSTHDSLRGQSQAALGGALWHTLATAGVDADLAPDVRSLSREEHDYSADMAGTMHRALRSVAAALEDFRADIPEEKSPIQVWPHHFDLSMIWLPGGKIPDQDPGDAEQSDKQMNFGFVFGDDSVREPYLYVTAYPLPEQLPKTPLPAGTTWRSQGFNGAVLRYRELVTMSDPKGYLLDMWNVLLAAGREHLGEA
jgi:hypothetical protein